MTADRLEAVLSCALARAFGDAPPGHIGVAVSGGGDSLAALVLVSDWARARGVEVLAATVDHGLRPEAAAGARHAGAVAAHLGVDHETLTGRVDEAGNLQAAARALRQRCLAEWAARRGISDVVLGHTRDDQAETVLMRLARGSGVDGLAGIAEIARPIPDGPRLLRPLLEVRRSDLRAVLTARGIGWCEDPSNDDARFDRVKVRRMLVDPPLPGLDADTLAETAARMGAARAVLDAAAQAAADRIAVASHGGIAFAGEGFLALPEETRWRLLAAALCRVGGRAYRPRLGALRTAEAALRSGRAHTLHGCLVAPAGKMFRIDREPAAAPTVSGVPCDWDGRWRISGPVRAEAMVGALGAADLAARGGAAGTGLPPAALAASPAIRMNGEVICAPLLDGKRDSVSGWSAAPIWGTIQFVSDFGPD